VAHSHASNEVAAMSEPAKASGLKPLTHCGCGCSLNFGVGLILSAFLVHSVYMLVTIFGDVVVQDPTFASHRRKEIQVWNACMALLALPFIISGFYALYVRCDSYLRPFLYFMVVSFVAEIGEWIVPLLTEGSCPLSHMGAPKGRVIAGMSAACGLMEVLFAFFICQLAAVEAYLIFTVWSLC